MKRIMPVLAFIVVASASVLGQADKGEQAIKSLSEQLRQATLKGDASSLEKLLADDFLWIDSTGFVRTKADELDGFKSGKLKYDTLDVSDMKVRVYGDTALVNTTAASSGHLGDRQFNAQYRTVRVWVKLKGTWQCVSYQATRVAQ